MGKLLELQTQNSATIKTLFEALNEFTTEILLEVHCTPEEKYISSRISIPTVYMDVKLEGKEFTKFECTKEEYFIPFKIEHFYGEIHSIEKNDVLTLKIMSEQESKLIIETTNEDKGVNTKSELDLMDPENKIKRMPNLVQTDCFIITMLASDFHKMCKEMNKKGGVKHIEFLCTKNSVVFSCKGDNVKTTKTFTTGTNNITIRAPAENAIAQGIYELKYLVYLSKCQSMCEKIQICMKNKYPLFITYSIGSMGRILVVLMPYTEKKNHDYGTEVNNYVSPQLKIKEITTKKILNKTFEDDEISLKKETIKKDINEPRIEMDEDDEEEVENK